MHDAVGDCFDRLRVRLAYQIVRVHRPDELHCLRLGLELRSLPPDKECPVADTYDMVRRLRRWVDVGEPLAVGCTPTEQGTEQGEGKPAHQTFPMQVLASKYALLVDP